MNKYTIATALIALTFSSCGRGPVGLNGPAGERGESGSVGVGCVVSEITASSAYPNGGAVVSCGDSSVAIKNGSNGTAGQNAVLEVINPCGDQGAHDEVLLRLADGSLLASFSDSASGTNTRFSVIGAGSYATTDGTNCHFAVDSAGNVTSN